MDEKELNVQKIDLFFMFRIWLRYAKQFWAAAIVLAVLCSVVLGYSGYRAYTPTYEASVSFTVKVSNPLYGSLKDFNNATASQLNATFPYILRSNILRQQVSEYLGGGSIPTITTTVLENSNIFTMRVRHSDPEYAYLVLQAMIKCYPQVADYVVGATDLVILDDSGVPTQPVYDLDLKGSMLLGAAAGVLLWALFILLLTLTRRTIHNEDELKRTLNFQCLGIIPATKVVGGSTGFPLVHKDNGKFGFGESVRLLQMHVQKEMDQQEKKVLMVSGATPGEGKTTIAVNLAISFAQRGMTVLLVDCDAYIASTFKALGKEEGHTVREFIDGKITANDLMNKTSVRHLYGMLANVDFKDVGVKAAFHELMTACRTTFDYIILDTPPSSLLVDAAEISDFADCALMVIRQDYASRDQILDGVRLLTDNGLPMIGCALNGVVGNLASSSYRYGNGYGYGYSNSYGYGYGSGKYDKD